MEEETLEQQIADKNAQIISTERQARRLRREKQELERRNSVKQGQDCMQRMYNNPFSR